MTPRMQGGFLLSFNQFIGHLTLHNDDMETEGCASHACSVKANVHNMKCKIYLHYLTQSVWLLCQDYP